VSSGVETRGSWEV